MSRTGATAAEAHALLERVIELDDAARASLLDAACAGRPALRARVEALLLAAATEHTLLDDDPALVWAQLIGDDEPPVAGVGPYRVVREIGRGGMGAVYLAERADGQFEKQVALKLVKRGMDTDEILARFRQERRILAGLEHPHIARLYDGGASDDGRPYLVMELVHGEPITAYCDRRRLPIDERLALFRTICAAVQHAHQMLVVHRDLKPSNILVTPEGVPKLLDFGIAKLLTEDDGTTPVTRTGVRVLTPEYAAPEQLRGEAVTTATDVYALGAILYELLTGSRPFQGTASGDAERVATRPSSIAGAAAQPGTDPGRETGVAAARASTPGALRRRLDGDLDVITLRALDPDPARRYGSAQQLLDDLERHAAGLPVLARAPTLAYRVRKFARRNRSALAAAALLVLSLVGGLAATVWQAQRAARERDAANLARSSAEQVAAFLLDMFDSADPFGVRMERTDTLRVRAIVDRGAERVHQRLAGQPRLQAEMLTVLGRVYAGLGVFPSADSVLDDALRLLRQAGMPAEAAVPLSVRASSARQQGEFARADSLLQQVLATYAAGGRTPDSLHAETLSERGLVLGYLGRYDEALVLHQQALAVMRRLDASGRPLHGRLLGNLGALHYDLGDFAQAEQVFREALAIERTYLPAGHPRLAATLNNLASSIQYQGRLAEAEPLFVEAVAIGRQGLGELHAEVGVYLQNLATLYDDQGRHDEAADAYRASIRVHEAALGRANVNTALLLRNFALNRFAIGARDEAEALLREALASMHEGLGSDHLYTGVTAAALGRVLTAAGRLGEAETHIRHGIAVLEEQFPDGHYLLDASRRDLGAWYAQRGEFTTAEPLLLRSHEALLASRGKDHYLTREARAHLHRMYEEWGRSERATAFAPDSATR